MSVKGYKVFKPDWTCRNFQYEVGKIFEEDVTPSCCNRGFHFCEKASDCFDYYDFDSNNKVAEVIALGDVATDGNKSCTNKIKIVREIPWSELLTIVNIGKDCTGLCNTGNRNTGDWNTCDRSTGCFCTIAQPVMFFDKPSSWTWNDWLFSKARRLLAHIPKKVVEWIPEGDMTDEEKTTYPTYETTGGYLKELDESESGQIWWDGLTDEEKDCIKDLPNFDPDIFGECTGIKIEGTKE